MYNKILVPLDGSKLAECVLPHVESIAKGCGVRSIVFLSVIELMLKVVGARGVLTEEQERQLREKQRPDVENYLKQIINAIKYDNVNLQSEIIMGEQSANIIANYATDNDVDLIVIATHGRSGISRWVWGSVADRILRSACVPVLMVRAPGCFPGI